MPSRSWAEGGLAALAVAALALGGAGCGSAEEGAGDATLTVYVSAPLSGAQARTGLAVADGAREALREAGDVGGVKLDAVVLDSGPGASAPAAGGSFDVVRAAANARTAVEDSTAIAYVGELESATTRTSLPITNDARLLQVSPTATASYLVAPFEGSDEIPAATQSSGVRTFGTVGELRGSPRELGREAMTVTLAAIGAADDPRDRASVVEAFFTLGEVDSPLGRYSVDELGVAEPLDP